MATTKITEGELEAVQYAIEGLLKEIQSDSIDMGYIREKLKAIGRTAFWVSKHQNNTEMEISEADIKAMVSI